MNDGAQRPGRRRDLREIVRLAAPLALVQLGHATMGLVDTAVVGHKSAADLAAVGLGNSIFFTVAILGMGIALGTEPLVSQAVGAGDPSRARRALRQGTWLALFLTVPLLAIVLGLLAVLPHLGVDPEIVPATRAYVLARSPELPAFLFVTVARAYLQGFGRTREQVIGVVVANVLNLGLDVWLVFGGLGVPALGAAGAGIATAFCTWVRLGLLITPILSLRVHDDRTLVVRWRAALETSGLLRVLKVGTPLGLQLTLEVAIFAFVAFSMGSLGKIDLAAHNLALMLASTPFNAMIGLASAGGVIVGRRIGAGDPRGARDAGLLTIGLSGVFMAVSGLSFVLMPRAYAALFTDDPQVVDRAVVLLQIAGAFALSDGVQAVASGVLRGAGDTAWAFVCHLVAHWAVGLPMALLFCFTLGMGAAGLWWGLTCGLTFAAVTLTLRFWWRGTRGYAALER